MAIELGTISDVDLRQVWNDEARDFAPWLKENIELTSHKLPDGLPCPVPDDVRDLRADLPRKSRKKQGQDDKENDELLCEIR
ncbi:MAG: hypothetical protein PWQ86_91 [Bacillota bacterium]|jgi:hypothetical protein|nr:hypothetical protein [Bacillota bacterium]